jgi:hypothetical protein
MGFVTLDRTADHEDLTGPSSWPQLAVADVLDRSLLRAGTLPAPPDTPPDSAAANPPRRSAYALSALVHLARHADDGYVTVKRIADARGIRARLLEQILSTLKHARYVRSVKGQRGGFRLARAASQIRLREIVRLFDGPPPAGGLFGAFDLPEQATIADVA